MSKIILWQNNGGHFGTLACQMFMWQNSQVKRPIEKPLLYHVLYLNLHYVIPRFVNLIFIQYVTYIDGVSFFNLWSITYIDCVSIFNLWSVTYTDCVSEDCASFSSFSFFFFFFSFFFFRNPGMQHSSFITFSDLISANCIVQGIHIIHQLTSLHVSNISI